MKLFVKNILQCVPLIGASFPIVLEMYEMSDLKFAALEIIRHISS
jgi:hypothetical protein